MWNPTHANNSIPFASFPPQLWIFLHVKDIPDLFLRFSSPMSHEHICLWFAVCIVLVCFPCLSRCVGRSVLLPKEGILRHVSMRVCRKKNKLARTIYLFICKIVFFYFCQTALFFYMYVVVRIIQPFCISNVIWNNVFSLPIHHITMPIVIAYIMAFLCCYFRIKFAESESSLHQ